MGRMVVDCIEKEGYTTFWGDRDLIAGDNFMSVIQDYLERADNLIAVLSPSYFTSVYCQTEVTAMLQKGKRIIPIKVSEEQPAGDIAKFLYVDLYNTDENNAKRRLIDAISNVKKEIRNIQFQDKSHIRFPGELPDNNLKFDESSVIGGENKIEAIREAFSHNGMVSSNLTLSGIGGVGKTTIAKKYIQKYGYLYDLIWWITAESAEAILQEYEKFAIEQKLVENSQNDEKDIVDIVKQWMSSTNNWLFVFDDVDEYVVIQPFVPNKHKGNILIISRNSLLKDSAIDEITLHELTTEQAREFLFMQGISGNDEEIAELIQHIGRLPLMLKNVADYIKRNQISIKKFLQKGFSLNSELEDSGYYSNLASVYREQGDNDKAIACYRKALELNKEEKNNADIYFSIAAIYQELGEFNRALELYNKTLSIQQSGLCDTVLVAKTYNNMATIYLQMQEFNTAGQLYKKSLDILCRELGEDHPSVATALNNIALVCIALGKYDEALRHNQKALLIREKVLGDGHPDTAASYINVAENYLRMEKLSDALVYYERGMDIYERTLGTKHPNISYLYKNIGDIYQKMEDYEVALEFYNKAMQSQESTDYKKDNEFVCNTYDIPGSSNDLVNITNLRVWGCDSYCR